MNRFPFPLIILCTLIALALAACGPRTVSLTTSASEYEFEPQSWRVPAGATVELTVINDGQILHDWTLMPPENLVEPPYDKEEQEQALTQFRVKGGETETFTFTAPSEPGEYPVLCTPHINQDMVGTLIVE